jgi:bacillopeptidase F
MTARLTPAAPFIPGEHYTVTIAAAGAPQIIDFGGTPVAADTMDFLGGQNSSGVVVQEAEGPAAVSTWHVYGNSHAIGGSYTADHLAGATARYGFSGTYITWYTIVGPNFGVADLYIDGVPKATVNCYRSTTAFGAAFTISGLSAAPHVLTIRVRGVKGSSAGTGTYIALDALRRNGVTINTPPATYTWGTVSSSSASGGTYIRADIAGQQTQFRFRGTQIEWDTVLGPGMGMANVYIDGVFKGKVDNYSATAKYQSPLTYGGLTDTIHTFTVVVLGTHRAGASGSVIAIDRWIVS